MNCGREIKETKISKTSLKRKQNEAKVKALKKSVTKQQEAQAKAKKASLRKRNGRSPPAKFRKKLVAAKREAW